MPDNVWVVIVREAGDDWYRAFWKQGRAFRDASEYIKLWAERELSALEWPKDDPGLLDLQNILRLLREMEYEDAYDLWQSYAADAEPGVNVEVVGIPVE
jgi:hypothetical protein